MRLRRPALTATVAVTALVVPATTASAAYQDWTWDNGCVSRYEWTFASDWAQTEDRNNKCTLVSALVFFNPPGTSTTLSTPWSHSGVSARASGKEMTDHVHGAY